MTDGIRASLGMDEKNAGNRSTVSDEIQHLRWRLQETEKERDRYRELLQRVIEE